MAYKHKPAILSVQLYSVWLLHSDMHSDYSSIPCLKTTIPNFSTTYNQRGKKKSRYKTNGQEEILCIQGVGHVTEGQWKVHYKSISLSVSYISAYRVRTTDQHSSSVHAKRDFHVSQTQAHEGKQPFLTFLTRPETNPTTGEDIRANCVQCWHHHDISASQCRSCLLLSGTYILSREALFMVTAWWIHSFGYWNDFLKCHHDDIESFRHNILKSRGLSGLYIHLPVMVSHHR